MVDFYFEHYESLFLTCRIFTVPKRILRRWIAQYQHSGINGLAVFHTKRTYTPTLNIKL
ncbi:helix-turn-helix domain-containing protein [Gallibacterium melopsittaci]|uniref:Helix-turn-helix domain-containing protein n=1 Tax=Gallibacterium melopsittaci TaxID=516063 RepID=A0ABV6HTZ4_9PAST